MAASSENVDPLEGFCFCGCGERTRLAPYTTRRLGWVKGQPISYVNGHSRRGKGTGWYFDPTKNRMYVIGRDGSRTEWYRIYMGNVLGRPLRLDESVHHRNGDSSDDCIENLVVMGSRAHTAMHARQLRRERPGRYFSALDS